MLSLNVAKGVLALALSGLALLAGICCPPGPNPPFLAYQDSLGHDAHTDLRGYDIRFQIAGNTPEPLDTAHVKVTSLWISPYITFNTSKTRSFKVDTLGVIFIDSVCVAASAESSGLYTCLKGNRRLHTSVKNWENGGIIYFDCLGFEFKEVNLARQPLRFRFSLCYLDKATGEVRDRQLLEATLTPRWRIHARPC